MYSMSSFMTDSSRGAGELGELLLAAKTPGYSFVAVGASSFVSASSFGSALSLVVAAGVASAAGVAATAGVVATAAVAATGASPLAPRFLVVFGSSCGAPVTASSFHGCST